MREEPRKWFVLLGLLLSVSVAAPAVLTSPAQVDRKTDPQKFITLDLQNASLADIVQVLGKKYGVNLITDAYILDVHLARVKIPESPLSVALLKLAELYQREVFVVNGIVIWRDRQWFLRKEHEVSVQGYGLKWKDSGRILIERLENRATESPAASLTASLQKEGSPDLLSLQVSTAPLKEVAEAFGSRTGWTVRIDPALASRRLNAYLHQVTSGQVLEALTWLFNGMQETTITQSKSQREQEAQLIEQALNLRPVWEKESAALKPELLRLLTPQQQAQLAQGEAVTLSLNSLPEELQKRAIRYIQMSCGALGDQAPVLDESRWSEFRLIIDPDPRLVIGVEGYDVNGNKIGF